MLRRIVHCLIALLLFLNGRAIACSIISEVAPPTNFERVQQADAIVVGTPIQSAQSANNDHDGVVFKVDHVLKGAPPATVTTNGWIREPPSIHADGVRASRDKAACGLNRFRRDRRYILLLWKWDGGPWGQTSYSSELVYFSGHSVDYEGEDDPWANTIRRYLKLQSTRPPLDQIRALDDMLGTRTDLDGSMLSQAELEDIENHLRSLSPDKPTEYLLEAYRQLDSGRTPTQDAHPRNANREKSIAEVVSRALLRTDDEKWSTRDQKLSVLNSLVIGEHPDAMPFFRRLQRHDGDPEIIGLTLRFLAANGAYPEAFAWVSSKLLPMLPRLSKPDQQRLIRHVAKLQTGDNDEQPRWRSDPRAASEWPELALKLYTWEVKHWGQDYAHFDDSIETIPITNYRNRPELTLVVAQRYDEGAHKWAVDELLRPSVRGESDAQRLRLPLLAILTAWTQENVPFLEDKVFCLGGDTRIALIRLTGEAADNLYGGMLLRVAASPLTSRERAAIRVAFAKWKARFGENPTPLYEDKGKSPQPIRCK